MTRIGHRGGLPVHSSAEVKRLHGKDHCCSVGAVVQPERLNRHGKNGASRSISMESAVANRRRRNIGSNRVVMKNGLSRRRTAVVVDCEKLCSIVQRPARKFLQLSVTIEIAVACSCVEGQRSAHRTRLQPISREGKNLSPHRHHPGAIAQAEVPPG